MAFKMKNKMDELHQESPRFFYVCFLDLIL